MAKEHEINLELKLGEQLTGLSPTVCKRAIFAIHDEDNRLGGESRKTELPEYCGGLLFLLGNQTNVYSSCDQLLRPEYRNHLYELLNQMTIFLNVVEGTEPTGTFDGEEESKRG
ncbi:MAG: hypothetical protein UU49_C0003G0007 [Candidatus Magasanikbacteria bacterium GW2011_GWC2_41_17]|uniref:Uncharacterized protein n=1 Tax=Candidatus Magasanikbacteria bacterium GW2011_GWC2_41_17 TaxID=1619048 RepID=A0A0G0VG62_9BACT|nr:MAG: hypothetical protein UU49_C0003G0007 [Candidatus Magasanikbacteria bacterium GW2011_GWC2_41_17]